MSQVLCSIKYVPKYGQILPKAVFGTHIWALLCFILWVRHLYRFSNVKSIGHCEWIWEYFFQYCPILSWSKYHNIIKIMKIGNFITTSRNLSLSSLNLVCKLVVKSLRLSTFYQESTKCSNVKTWLDVGPKKYWSKMEQIYVDFKYK